MEHYDLVVVGSGAGLTLIEEALQKGLKCALVEKDKLGGTCLNRGCIPSKVLVYPADLIRETEHAGKTGVFYGQPEISWSTISRRMWQFIDRNQQIEENLRQIDRLTLYRGQAQFTGLDTLQVTDERQGHTDPFTADMIVLACGARSRVPQIKGLAEAGFITAESFFGPAFPRKPWSSLTIIGGGAIGLEFAHIFSAQGTRVTLIEAAPALAPLEEPEISEFLEKALIRQGVRVLTGKQIVEAEKTTDGKSLKIRTADGRDSDVINSEEIFLAAGVQSNADLINVEKAGIATDARNYIITNEYLETNKRHIWALGDVNGKYQFRHKANYEAEVLVHNLLRPDLSRRSVSYQAVPWAIFSSPQIAHVGLKASEAIAAGIPFQVGYNHYSDIAKGYAMGYEPEDPDDGFVKLIVDEKKKILGVHIIGPQAAVLLQPFVYLMNAGFRCTGGLKQEKRPHTRLIPGLFPPCSEAGSLDPLAHSMVIHPSLSELTAWVIENLEWQDPAE